MPPKGCPGDVWKGNSSLYLSRTAPCVRAGACFPCKAESLSRKFFLQQKVVPKGWATTGMACGPIPREYRCDGPVPPCPSEEGDGAVPARRVAVPGEGSLPAAAWLWSSTFLQGDDNSPGLRFHTVHEVFLLVSAQLQERLEHFSLSVVPGKKYVCTWLLFILFYLTVGSALSITWNNKLSLFAYRKTIWLYLSLLDPWAQTLGDLISSRYLPKDLIMIGLDLLKRDSIFLS